MKKVGILVNSLGYGGNERSAASVASALAQDYDITIITQEDNGNPYGYSGKVIDLHTPCASSKVGKCINAVKRIVRLFRIIRNNQFDSLIIILPVTNPINYLRFKCRTISSCRDCGDLIKNTDKYVAMLKRANVMICNSTYMHDYLTMYAPECAGKIKTIHNILDVDRIVKLAETSPEQQYVNFTKDRLVVTAAGRFTAAKGWNNLLKAFSLVRQQIDACLVLMGEGEEKENIKQLIMDLSLQDSVFLIGFQNNPFRYIARSNVFVLPSYYEGFPNMLIEAMACSVPVVATDCPSGPAEILNVTSLGMQTMAQCGILVKKFDEKENSWSYEEINEDHRNLAQAIISVLLDENKANTMGQKSFYMVQKYRAESIRDLWKEIL